jgi:hypothetical protein
VNQIFKDLAAMVHDQVIDFIRTALTIVFPIGSVVDPE